MKIYTETLNTGFSEREKKRKEVSYSIVLNTQSSFIDLSLSCDSPTIFGLTYKIHTSQLSKWSSSQFLILKSRNCMNSYVS